MALSFRGILLASLSVLALGACSTTSDPNMSNTSESARVDSILQRAAADAKANGNTTDSVVLLEKIYQRNPNDAAVATSFGQALREDEQFNRARQVLAPFADGKNAYPDAVTELSMVQLSLGQYKESELTARRAVELDPNSGRAYLALGTALDAQNYHEQAEVAFRRGIDKWKGDPAPIMNNLALNLASQNQLDQAIDMLKKAQEISPGRVELERNMRIITTLKEGADDFTTKKAAAAAAPAPAAKAATTTTTKEVTIIKEKTVETPVPAKKAETKAAADADKSQKDIDNKQLPAKATSVTVTTPDGGTVKKTFVKAKPEKVEPAAANEGTNSRGSTQNFNKKSATSATNE